MFFPSRIYAPHAGVIGHTVYRQHVRSGAGVDRVRISISTKIIEASDHCVLKPLVHNILAPEVAHAILNPLKVRDRYAASVGQYVWDYKNSLLVQDLIRGRCCWPIGTFGKDFALQAIRVLGGNL